MERALLIYEDLRLTPPGYGLPPHPRLLPAGGTIGAYLLANLAQQNQPGPSRRIGPLKPDFAPRQSRPPGLYGGVNTGRPAATAALFSLPSLQARRKPRGMASLRCVGEGRTRVATIQFR